MSAWNSYTGRLAKLTGDALILVLSFLSLQLRAQSGQDIEKISRLVHARNADTATISALMKMGDAFIASNNGDTSAVNAAFYISRQLEVLSTRLNDSAGFGLSQLLLAKAYRLSGNNTDGRTASSKALRLLSLFGKPLQKAEALIELGGTYANSTPDLPVKIGLYQQAIGIIHEYGDRESEARMKEFLGELYQDNRQFSESIRVLNESLELYKKVGYGRLHGVYSIMGDAYNGLNNYVESLKYNLLAIKVGERYNDKTALMEAVYNRVGINYYNVRYYEQAIEYFNKALEIARMRADTPIIKTMLLNISSGLINVQQHARSLDSVTRAMTYGGSDREIEKVQIEMLYIRNYIALNQLAKIEPHYKKMLEYYHSGSMSETAKQVIRLSIILCLQAEKRFKETIPFLQDYQLYVNTASIPLNMRADGELYAFRTDSALGNLSSAIHHFQTFKTLSDSLTSTTQGKQMGVLQLQFQTEQKDKNIELLTQKSQLQEASLQQEKVFRNIVIGSTCMLILFMSLIYSRYLTKKRATLQLEAQQNEINDQNGKLKRLLDEKEWLLKEIHHRVKNNLQIVISLLNTQSKYLDSEDAKAAIQNSQHRMYAMSLIHQKLYQTDDLGRLDMDWYIKQLAGHLKDSFDKDDNIKFIIENDPVSLDVVQAVPLGLIINEAVNNSIKYAFPEDLVGIIRIGLKKAGDDHCILLICDNGTGVVNPESVNETKSLGMSLMRGLAEQLDGDFLFYSGENGVTVSLNFPHRSFTDKISFR